MSFDHGQGEWIVVGTMTVSDDGAQLIHKDITISAPAMWKEGIEARKGKEIFVGLVVSMVEWREVLENGAGFHTPF